jgi:uncharacterized protein (DUF433 family)
MLTGGHPVAGAVVGMTGVGGWILLSWGIGRRSFRNDGEDGDHAARSKAITSACSRVRLSEDKDGTRIRVRDVVAQVEYQERGPADVVSSFPALFVSDVYAALTYYYERPTQIRREIREREARLRGTSERSVRIGFIYGAYG